MYTVLTKRVLANIVAFLVMFNIHAVAVFVSGNQIFFVNWLLLVPFMAFFVIRQYAKTVIVFCVLHFVVALIAGVIAFISGFGAVVLLAVLLIYSFAVRARGENQFKKCQFVFIFLAKLMLYFILFQAGDSAIILRHQLVMSSIAIGCIVILYFHVDNMDVHLLLANARGRRGSFSRVKKANTFLIMMFTSAFFVLGTVSVFLPVGQLVAAAGRFLLHRILDLYLALVWVLGLFNFTLPELQLDNEEIYELSELGVGDSNGAGIVIFQNQSLRVVIVLLLIALFFGLFLKHFSNAKDRGLLKDDTIDEETEELPKSIFADLLDLLPKFNYLKLHAIRRKYYKTVSRHIKNGVIVNKYDVTDTIAKRIGKYEDITDLTKKYERVRYGRELEDK